MDKDYRWIKALSDSYLTLHLQAQSNNKHPDDDLINAIKKEFKDRTKREQAFRELWKNND